MEIKKYDAIVVGSGHAGCEAALALARMGSSTLLLTMNLDSVAFLACNPSIGGTAKGQLASEIDALGGEMGVNADKTLLQLRMLNVGSGPAVHSLRAQVDKHKYHSTMKRVLEETPNLTLKQAEAVELMVEAAKITKTSPKGDAKEFPSNPNMATDHCSPTTRIIGVKTAYGETIYADAVIICTGVYLDSRVIIGEFTKNQGPNGFMSAVGLTDSLKNLGFEIRRFKTGTPARVLKSSIDLTKFEPQPGDENIQTFSRLTKKQPPNICDCYLGYTNERTHEIIRANFGRAPLFSGFIKGVGPRYCPSMEDKVYRFADKNRHQIFLEPESLETNEIYVQGFSSSMPVDVQEEMYKSVNGFENLQILRYAYAIEYDCINSLQLLPTLEAKHIAGLYFAGQINGTSGYEEAAAQGIIAGINAGLKLKGKPPFVLGRDKAYIGVLVDDLVTKGTNEPYRMMTSRAEHRLILRQDNADMRLTELGRQIGLVTDERYKIFVKKKKQTEKAFAEIEKLLKPAEVNAFLKENNEAPVARSITIKDLLKRTNITAHKVKDYFAPDCFVADAARNDERKTKKYLQSYSDEVLNYINIEVKYEGYLKRSREQILQAGRSEDTPLDPNFDYNTIKGLRIEARQKLNKIKPLNLGQAGRISGVSPADIAVLTIYLKSLEIKKKKEDHHAG